MNNNLAIIGGGAWGSALSIGLFANFNTIYLICQNEYDAKNLKNGHPNLKVKFKKNIILSTDYHHLKNSNAILIATPSDAFREVLTKIKPYLHNQSLAWATKGFVGGKLLHQWFTEILPDHHPCIISGPSFAFEVARFKPTALVVASTNIQTSKIWAKHIKTNSLRTYISDDVIGVEIGGAVKNVLAIASGISSGLGFNTNTMSALITRGLAEMTRFGVSLGGKSQTFTGLTGLGDLTLTCLDDLSRNRRFGKQIAKNFSVKEALKSVNGTVEGLNTLTVVLKIAKQHNIEMPICEKVRQVIDKEISTSFAVESLMTRATIYED